MRRIMFPASIFVQLITIFLVVVIPLYGLGTQVYTWANDVVKRGITETARAQVDFYIGNLDKDITRMKALQYDLMFDTDLNQLAAIPESLNEIDKIMALLRLQKRLLTIRHSNDLIEDVFVYIPPINKIIESGDMRELNASEMNMTLGQWLNVGSKLVFHQHKAALVTQKLDKFGEPTFVIAIMLSEDKLRQQLKLFEQNRDSGLLLTDLNGSMYLTVIEDSALTKPLEEFKFRDTDQASVKAIEYEMNGSEYIFMYARSDKLGINLFKFILQDDIFTEMKHYQLWFVLFTILAIVLILLFSFLTYKLIKRPLGKLISAFRMLEEGDLDIQIVHHRRNDEFNFLYARFNLMVNRLKQMMEQVYLQTILAQRSELKHLQSQITPHFLYNSFFVLSNMVESEDHENAKLFSRQLGEYLRFVTRNASPEVVLAEEVRHARTYAEIQARRFRKRIKLFFEQLPQEWESVFVPRLIIQPIIENVFEHGLNHKTENGHISIVFRPEENEQSCALVIAIEDNGDELTEGRLHELQSQLNNCHGEIEVTGLINVHHRLRLKFGEPYGLELAIGQSGGLRVNMKIPRGS